MHTRKSLSIIREESLVVSPTNMGWLRMKDAQLIILCSFTNPGFESRFVIILCIRDNFMFGFKLVLCLGGKIAFLNSSLTLRFLEERTFFYFIFPF